MEKNRKKGIRGKTLLFFFSLSFFCLFFPSPLFAQEKAEESFCQKTSPPLFSLTLPPTPSPPIAEKKSFLTKDNRSWKKSPYCQIIGQVAQKYQLDPQLLYATIMVESNGQEKAFRFEPKINDASVCLGQILISTARRLGFTGNLEKLYEPEICLDYVGKYYHLLLQKYGELPPLELAKIYNTGSPTRLPRKNHLFRFQKWYEEKG